VAFGCWPIVGGFNWGPQDEQDSIGALRAAYDAGVTFYDTAEGDGDGRSEALIAAALEDVRDEIVIASKVSPKHVAPYQLKAACERSLKHLRTDRIDLYQVHWPSTDIPVADTMGALMELKGEGKIRHAAVSNFGVLGLTECLRHGEVASDQLAYNLLFRAIEFDILPFCRQRDIPILCYCPILQGLLAGKFAAPDDVPPDRARTRHFSHRRPNARHGEPGAEDDTFAAISHIRTLAESVDLPMADLALAWLIAQDGVGAVLVGARNADQAARNARAADVVLPTDVMRQLDEITDALKQTLGPNADLWQGDCRVR